MSERIYFSGARLESTKEVLNALPHFESCNHALKILESHGVKDINAIKELSEFCVEHQREVEEQAFNGVRVPVHINSDDLALLNEASQRKLNEPVSKITFDIASVEQDKNIGQERQVPIVFFLGDERLAIEEYAQFYGESSDDCQVKLRSLLNTWLRSFGLAYDDEHATIIQLDTKKPPNQAELKTMLTSEANKAITKEARKIGLLQEDGDIAINLTVLNFEKRPRAVPVFEDKVTP